jgi:predicted Ser/Thr protein kinase
MKETKLTRKFVEDNTIQYLRSANDTRPDIRVVKNDSQKLVVKDFKESAHLFRSIVGPILIRREYGALKKLDRVEGIPKVYCKLDRYAFVMEYIDGSSLENIQKGMVEDNFFDQLHTIIDEMHKRGVAHCDLRSKGNVVLSNGCNPYIVDFAASVFKGMGINPITRIIFKLFVNADNNAILRIKNRLSPQLLTEDEIFQLSKQLPFEPQARKIGDFFRLITKKFLTNSNEHK